MNAAGGCVLAVAVAVRLDGGRSQPASAGAAAADPALRQCHEHHREEGQGECIPDEPG